MAPTLAAPAQGTSRELVRTVWSTSKLALGMLSIGLCHFPLDEGQREHVAVDCGRETEWVVTVIALASWQPSTVQAQSVVEVDSSSPDRQVN